MSLDAVELTIDLDPAPPVSASSAVATVSVGHDLARVTLTADPPAITLGVPGPIGPPGPPGLTKVTHGSDPNVARPDAPLVYWVGTVQPIHADPDDLLMLKG